MIELLPSLEDAMFRPRSIALVGASDKRTAPGGRPLHFLRKSGYSGRIYPVNAVRSQVQGEQCWPSLDELPEVPDHAYLLVPASRVLEELARCVKLGVPFVTILASGFAEAGADGRVLHEKVVALLRGTGTRVLGPSSLGVANIADNVRVTANAAIDGSLPSGRFLFVSHSGSLMGAVATRAAARGIGFSGLVSVGGEIDVSMAEVCTSVLDDPCSDGCILFLEHLKHAAELGAFAEASRKRNKPVVAYKLGKTGQAARMAATHTGAIVGRDDIAEAFFRSHGIVRLHYIDALLPGAQLARSFSAPRARKARIGMVSTTGGGAAMLVDELGLRDMQVVAPSHQIRDRLQELGILHVGDDVVDLTLAGTRPEVMSGALTCMLNTDEHDLVLVVLGSSAATQPEAATQPLIEAAQRSDCPIAVLVLPDAPRALSLLASAGLPAFSAPEHCADAVTALCKSFNAPRCTFAVEDGLQIARGSPPMAALSAIGIEAAPERILALDAPSVDSMDLPYPVAVKVFSDSIEHKTDLGGVLLNVTGPQGLQGAIDTLRERFATMGAVQAQVQSMVQRGLSEVLVGFLRDDEVGPIVTLAPGGVLADLARHRSVRLAPVDPEEALSMIMELSDVAAVLTGYRGRPKGDLQALAHSIHRFSLLASVPEVREAEINPLIVKREGEGVVAVDFLLRMD